MLLYNDSLVQTHKAVHSSSIKAIKCYGHSAVSMDEEQLTKESREVFITVRKEKLATTMKKDFFK